VTFLDDIPALFGATIKSIRASSQRNEGCQKPASRRAKFPESTKIAVVKTSHNSNQILRAADFKPSVPLTLAVHFLQFTTT
jgi:hypothetical protein